MAGLPQETIRRKRDGGVLGAGDIRDFIAGFADERVTEGQAAAFAMAVFFNGLDRDETVALRPACAIPVTYSTGAAATGPSSTSIRRAASATMFR